MVIIRMRIQKRIRVNETMDKLDEKTKLIVELAENYYYYTLKQIADAFYEKTGHHITQPTVAVYLKKAWGDEYLSKKKDMLKRFREKMRLERNTKRE